MPTCRSTITSTLLHHIAQSESFLLISINFYITTPPHNPFQPFPPITSFVLLPLPLFRALFRGKYLRPLIYMLNIDSCMAKIVHADYYVGKLLKLHQLPPWQLLVTHMGNVSHCRLGRSLSLCITSRETPSLEKK